MDRRTILAFILIALVIFFYDDYIRLFYPAPPEGSFEPTIADTSRQRTPSARTSPDAPITSSETPAAAAVKQRALQSLSFREPTYPVRYFTIGTDHKIARLTSGGARVVSLKL